MSRLLSLAELRGSASESLERGQQRQGAQLAGGGTETAGEGVLQKITENVRLHEV